jgi:formylmethanofuran dehydrogenase subunit C
MIILTPLKKFTFPVNAEIINPDIFQGKDTAEIADLTVFEGNKQRKLRELFKIKEDNAKATITINGDVSEVRKIGAGMKNG